MSPIIKGFLWALAVEVVFVLAYKAWGVNRALDCEAAKLTAQAFDYCSSGDGGAGCFLSPESALAARRANDFYYDYCGGAVPDYRTGG